VRSINIALQIVILSGVEGSGSTMMAASLAQILRCTQNDNMVLDSCRFTNTGNSTINKSMLRTFDYGNVEKSRQRRSRPFAVLTY